MRCNLRSLWEVAPVRVTPSSAVGHAWRVPRDGAIVTRQRLEILKFPIPTLRMPVMKKTTNNPRWRIRLLFIVLVPCLLFQLKLRTDSEPYPAILLPSGASILRTVGSYTGLETECLAEDSGGSKYPFSVATVLDAVPSDYHPYVVEAGFGINRDRMVRHLPLPFTGRRVPLGRPRTQSQIEATRAWLRARLRQTLGIDAVRIHILTYAVTTYYSEVPVREQKQLQADTTVELVGARR